MFHISSRWHVAAAVLVLCLTFEILSTALRVVHPPRTLIPALEMSAIGESSHSEAVHVGYQTNGFPF